jgi:hypothetical protein
MPLNKNLGVQRRKATVRQIEPEPIPRKSQSLCSSGNLRT